MRIVDKPTGTGKDRHPRRDLLLKAELFSSPIDIEGKCLLEFDQDGDFNRFDRLTSNSSSKCSKTSPLADRKTIETFYARKKIEKDVMFWKRRKQVLQEFKTNIGFYSQLYIISYLPPSQCFSIREEVNSKGAIQDPIVLLEIILHSSSRMYRWRRLGIVEQIQLADKKQEWEPIFLQIFKDMKGELDRELLNWKI